MIKKIILAIGTLALVATSCSSRKIQPPHVVLHCKAKFDACMIKNTFEGPLKAHKICMRKRSRKCR